MKKYALTPICVACLSLFISNQPVQGAIYYVKQNGVDAPERDGLSSETAWATLPYAASRVPGSSASERQIIRLSSGTFQQDKAAILADGVNVEGAGVGKTFINANWTNTPDELSRDTPAGRLIQINGTKHNRIANISFLGNARWAGGAVWIDNSSHVDLFDLTFTNYGSSALVLASNTAFVTVSNAVFSECGYESTNYSLGAIQLYQVRDSFFTHVMIVSTRDGAGYGFKASGLDGHGHIDTWVSGTVFENLEVKLKPVQLYQNAGYPNFSLEFFNTHQTNNELRHCYLRNTVSQSSADETRDGTHKTMRIHHNVFDLMDSAYAIECKSQRLEIDHNTFKGGYGDLCDWTCGTSDMDRLYVHDNVAEEVGQWFFSFTCGLTNLRLHNNKVHFADKPYYTLHVFLNNCNMGKTVPRDIDVRNNEAVSPKEYPGAFYKVENSNTLTPVGVVFANNTYSNMTFKPPTGSTVTASLNPVTEGQGLILRAPPGE